MSRAINKNKLWSRLIMQLNFKQKQQIFEDGFVHVPGVVPRVMIEAAQRAINNSLGQGVHPDDIARFSAQSYCPEVQSTPVITDLYNATPLRALAESAIAPDVLKGVGSGQIALRFPTLKDPPPLPRAHLDGVYTPTNGVPKGTIASFTALVAVLLSDLERDDAGNFTVWPGSHHVYRKHFAEHGHGLLLGEKTDVEIGAPKAITGRAGDVILCHYQLGHGITPNVSPDVRYAVFFRLKHHDHEAQSIEVLTDIWRHWPGIREAIPEARQA